MNAPDDSVDSLGLDRSVGGGVLDDAVADMAAVDAVDKALPQTQCTRCGFPDCRSYARAIVVDGAAINRCPPGGIEGVATLAALTGRERLPLDPDHGAEGPLRLAVIDESWCIGCTLCLKACPVDCIVGGPKAMHTVIDSLCTGCELCIPACPVDCISLIDVSATRTGGSAWSRSQAAEARARYQLRCVRLETEAALAEARLAEKADARIRSLQAAAGR